MKSELKTFWEQVNRDDLVPGNTVDRQTLGGLARGDIKRFGEELAVIRLTRNRAMEAGEWGAVNALSDMVQELVSDLEESEMEDLAWFVERAHFGGLSQIIDSKESFERAWERRQVHQKAREEAHRRYFGL